MENNRDICAHQCQLLEGCCYSSIPITGIKHPVKKLHGRDRLILLIAPGYSPSYRDIHSGGSQEQLLTSTVKGRESNACMRTCLLAF